MTEENSTKRVKLDDGSAKDVSPSLLTTFFIRCPSLHNRGDVVNGLLYTLKDDLDIADWFFEAEDGSKTSLKRNAPVEIVFVQSSRRPYFLLEFRYPTEQEQEKRMKNLQEKTEDDTAPDSGAHTLERIADAKIESVTDRFKQLLERNGLRYKEEDVSLSVSSGPTVSSEREKLELRDSKKKAEHIKTKSIAEPSAEKQAKSTAVSFVPRSMRRRN
ncbi:hypothetical protein AGDE_00878 [Angomonas deanei]|nr:hypothetical protein AGDE_01781 [Angomonas deanei]EPY43045.1 hypothetical protein AGDE_00878 [Angomonas deanei]|eukprot:EPY42142.1 hypothetical protein AGDE_01781 [Angomonas deanei]